MTTDYLPSKLSCVVLLALVFPSYVCADAGSIAKQLGLSSSTVLPFPEQTKGASDTVNFIKSEWSLQDGISFGANALAFVTDPIGGSGSSSPSGSSNSSNSPEGGSGSGDVVFAVTYNAGTYSHGTGGAQFYATFGGEQGFDAMLLSYDIAFDQGYNWVKGGKLPGLRGGPVLNSCSGGREPTGSDCFSSRLMWRTDGAGEVYAYIPSQPALCNVEGIECNSDYGFSMGRGKFKFTAGQWQNVAVYSKMNDPPSASNGAISMYFNEQQVFQFTGLKFRTSAAVTAGGMYFSTFFGGSDSTWATPKTVHTYYKNFQMYGGVGAGSTNSTTGSSTGINATVTSSGSTKTSSAKNE